MKTTYEVSHREGAMCRDAGLEVSANGARSKVHVLDGRQRETFWAQRLAFLRANPDPLN